eukprot:SAG31_NODE_11548_length_1018_cov_1.396083_1_plen_247_part_10
MHVSGFFNGQCGGVHKAHLPSVIGIDVTNANKTLTQSALDIRRAVYMRRLLVADANGAPQRVEQRIFAHRVRKHVMVTEFELLPSNGTAAQVKLSLSSLYDPLCGPPPPSPPSPPGPAFNGSYLRVAHDSGGNGHDVSSLPECVNGLKPGVCTLDQLRAKCNALPNCDLFQTHGFLKRCTPLGAKTNKTTACQAQTPWPNVDSYYKIRGSHDPAQTTSNQAKAEEFPPSPSGGFGLGKACGIAGEGC